MNLKSIVEMSSSIMHYSLIPKYSHKQFRSCFIHKSREMSSCIFRCKAQPCSTQISVTERRSGNYKAPIWDFDYIQSMNTEYTEEEYQNRASKLLVQVKKLLDDLPMGVQQLELIDDLQRMGISYHFQDKITQILNQIYVEHHYNTDEKDLYSTSLQFRLLRQHGFKVSQDVFHSFMNDEGDFKRSLAHDTLGLLQLYEASFLLTQGEHILELAREFTTNFLRKTQHEADEHLSLMVRRALELPIHWRAQRPNARWFIEAYERRPNMNPTVLELAKLDFNIVQASHQEELKHVKETGLAETLPFARDRLVENYFWTIGGLFELEYGYSRIMVTKVNAFITIIDDIFDVYATLEELLHFNDIIQRWDIGAVDQLPNYMQMCFMALNNFVNEMAYDVLKDQGILIIPHLRKSWADLCQTYMVEAKWYSRGYTPKLEEYIENAWISISAPVILTHSFFLITKPIQKELLQSLYKHHELIRCSGMVLRLSNDLGTSKHEMERGDVAKTIECYMNEEGGSREDAREYVKEMIWETWKKMNEERVMGESEFPRDFVRSAVDLGRMAQYMYHHGDGHGIQNPSIKHSIFTLLFQPIF